LTFLVVIWVNSKLISQISLENQRLDLVKISFLHIKPSFELKKDNLEITRD